MANQRKLDGKRILVTGGTTGIGRAIVKLLADHGARMLTFGRHQPELDDALENAGLGAYAGLIADVSKPEEVQRVFSEVDERLGGIDMLVANAALAAEPIHEMDEESWRYVVQTNLLGYMACARASIERMQRSGEGHLLFVSSISAEIKAPGESVYAATKAGIDAFAETLRKEIQDKQIKVTLIAPGSVGSDMQPSPPEEQREKIARQEMLYAEEIAEGVLFALTRSPRCDVVSLRMEPLIQKTS